ncbi:unnamed protein product, partial [Choristocarpus tenellus]
TSGRALASSSFEGEGNSDVESEEGDNSDVPKLGMRDLVEDSFQQSGAVSFPTRSRGGSWSSVRGGTNIDNGSLGVESGEGTSLAGSGESDDEFEVLSGEVDVDDETTLAEEEQRAEEEGVSSLAAAKKEIKLLKADVYLPITAVISRYYPEG